MVVVNQITPVAISALPAATTLTGDEATAIVQGGQTVQAPISQYPQGMSAGVIVYGNTGGAPFPNFRTLKAGHSVTFTDGGAQGDLTISFIGNGTGTVTTSGSPAAGNLTKFSDSLTITNGNLSGDITTTDTLVTTLATVNANVGSFGSTTLIPSFTVNAKGLITGASTNAVVAPAGTLSGTTLAVNVTGSSLTSVGTLTNLTVTNPISGSITGNAATVTTNANLTGDVTSVGNAATIAPNAVTYPKIQKVKATSVVGNLSATLDNGTDISAAAGQILALNSGDTVLGFTSVPVITGPYTVAGGNNYSTLATFEGFKTNGGNTVSGSTSTTLYGVHISGNTVTGTVAPVVNGIRIDGSTINTNSGVPSIAGIFVAGNTLLRGGLSASVYGIQIAGAAGTGSSNYTGSVANIISSSSSLSGTDTVTTIFNGRFTGPSLSGSASVTSYYGLQTTGPSVSGATLSNSYGLNVLNMGASGVTTSYGIRIESQSGSSTNFSLYCADGFFVRSNGNVVVGTSPISTSATAGFPWIPSCTGTPSGAPLTPYLNAAALVVDTSATKLWVLVAGTWRFVTLT